MATWDDVRRAVLAFAGDERTVFARHPRWQVKDKDAAYDNRPSRDGEISRTGRTLRRSRVATTHST